MHNPNRINMVYPFTRAQLYRGYFDGLLNRPGDLPANLDVRSTQTAAFLPELTTEIYLKLSVT